MANHENKNITLHNSLKLNLIFYNLLIQMILPNQKVHTMSRLEVEEINNAMVAIISVPASGFAFNIKIQRLLDLNHLIL